MAPYGDSPNLIDLNTLLIWIHIHDLPFWLQGYDQNPSKQGGEFEAVDPLHWMILLVTFNIAKVRIDPAK
jgi:hypothetical protein